MRNLESVAQKMLSLKFPAFQKDEIEIIGIIEAVATGIMYVSKIFL